MFHAAKIVKRYLASPTVVVLELEVSKTLKTFLPGQWVDFVVQPHTWTGGFSIASSPKLLPSLTLAIKKSDHPPSMWVHNPHESVVGRSVEIQVGGTCTLTETDIEQKSSSACCYVFVAGGIGISPILSQYRQVLECRRQLESQQQQLKSVFLYSVSTQDELVFGDEIVNLDIDAALDKLVFTMTKSSDNEWKGPIVAAAKATQNLELKTGRIMKEFLDEVPVPGDGDDNRRPSSSSSQYYICGPPNMLDDAISYLESNKGIHKGQLHYEKWW